MSNYGAYHDSSTVNSLSGSPVPQRTNQSTMGSGQNQSYNGNNGVNIHHQSHQQQQQQQQQPHNHHHHHHSVNSNTSLWSNGSPSSSADESTTSSSSSKVTPFQTYPKRDGIIIDTTLSKTDLMGLDMSGFRIKKLPIDLFNFHFMTELRLSGNYITVIPPEIGLLRSLTSLDLSNNQLSSVPRELSKLTGLTELLLYNNQLTLLPAELGYLYQLESFGLEGNPIMEPILSVLHSQGAIMVIPFLRDHMINTSPPMERFWHSLDQYNNSANNASKGSFTVLTYNILAEKYATAQMYGYVPSWALIWDYRKQMILHEILSYDADIICLQEVEANQFDQYFKPQLRMRGSYDGIFYPKSRAKTMNDWDRTFVDGCAIFFKSDRFKLEERHLIEFNQVALARPSLRKHKDMYNRVMTRDNIAVACRLTHVESEQSILVGTVHIHWDPSHKDVKLVQTIMLVEEMEKLLSKHPQSCIVLCGDFNALTESGVGEFLENGSIGAGHEDFGSHTYEPYSTDGAHHSLNLRNSYSLLTDEPLSFTNYTPDFCGIIDYIWYRPTNLSVTGLLGSVPPDYSKQFVGFPSQHMPSDHIPLLVEFKLEGPSGANANANEHQQPSHSKSSIHSSGTSYSNVTHGHSHAPGMSAASAVSSNIGSSNVHTTSQAQSQSQAQASSSLGRRLYSRNKSVIS